MNFYRYCRLLVAGLALCLSAFSTNALAITDAQVFAFAEANYPSIFTGTGTAGVYQQYNYRYYPASQNYLAVDTYGFLYVLGPYTGGVATVVGPVADFAPTITAWEATQAGTGATAATTGGTSSSLVGTWFSSNTGSGNQTTTYNSDGTWQSTTVEGSITCNTTSTYTVSGNTLTVVPVTAVCGGANVMSYMRTITGTFLITGNQLTLTTAGVTANPFTRQ